MHWNIQFQPPRWSLDKSLFPFKTVTLDLSFQRPCRGCWNHTLFKFLISQVYHSFRVLVYIWFTDFFFPPATQRTPKATEVVFPIKSATNVDLRILVDKIIGLSAVWGDPYKPYVHVLTPDVEGKGYFLLGLTAEPTKERMTWWWWCVVRTACGTFAKICNCLWHFSF